MQGLHNLLLSAVLQANNPFQIDNKMTTQYLTSLLFILVSKPSDGGGKGYVPSVFIPVSKM